MCSLPVDRAELRRLAEAATRGLWHACEDEDGVPQVSAGKHEERLSYVAITSIHEDAAYIAAASPAVVLALLDEIEQVKDNQHYAETRVAALASLSWESFLVMRGLTMQPYAVRDSDTPVNLPTPEAVTKLIDEITRLEGALERYGAHHLGCSQWADEPFVPSAPCSCGLNAARRPPASP